MKSILNSQFKVGDLGLLILNVKVSNNFFTQNQWMYITHIGHSTIYAIKLIQKKFSNGYPMDKYVNGDEWCIDRRSMRGMDFSFFKYEKEASEYLYKRQMAVDLFIKKVPILDVDEFAGNNIEYFKWLYKNLGSKPPKRKFHKLPKKPVYVNGYVYKELEGLVL